jgi:phage repressor protein C with HTH and peptisase S24 domain
MRLRKSSGQPKRYNLPGHGRLVIRQVKGESMAPALLAGQVVFGRRVQALQPGDVVIVAHQGLEKIKRVERTSGDLLYLLGDNSGASTDSRSFGWVQADAVVAKVVWPRLL